MSDTPTHEDLIERSEFDDPATRHLAERMAAAGEEPYDTTEVDYFAFDDTFRVDLRPAPGNKTQFVELKVFTEGDKRLYQSKTNRSVKVQKGSGDAILNMAVGEDRKILFQLAVVDFQLYVNGQPLFFNAKNLDYALDKLRPSFWENIEKELRKRNPWLQGDASLKDLLEERENLDQRIEEKRREESATATF
jgi:hypothetical protein